jgi:membrane protease YdiL (CAAX protease family)
MEASVRRRLGLSLFVLAVFALADELGRVLRWIPAYDTLRESSLYVASLVRTLLGLALVTVAAALFRRSDETGPWRALGVSAPLVRPLVAMLVAGLPMLFTYGLAAGAPTALAGTELLFGAAVWPLREEWIYRGYAFGQLTQRAGWSFWPAALVTSLLFSLGHLYQVVTGALDLGGALGILAITGAGGVFYCWLFRRWGTNLWAPFFLHLFMNLWWSVFSVDETALGGVAANLARAATIVVAILVTLRWAPKAAAADTA